MKNLGMLGSSEDSSRLSTTISGLLIGSAVFIVMIAQWLGFTITTEEVTSIAVSVGAAIATLVTLYGLAKKFVIAVQQKLGL